MESRDPVDVLICSNRLITAFDEATGNDPTYESTADEQCRHVISFLWAASHELVDPISFVTATDDIMTIRWSTTRHATCIMPEETTTDPNDKGEMLLALANSIQVQT